MEREKIVDVSKGIGLIFLVAGHLFTYGTLPFRFIFAFHMPLFFLLSGYVFNYTRGGGKKNRKQICHQFLRLMIPYLFFSVVGFFVTILVPVWRNEITLKNFLYQEIWIAQPGYLSVGSTWFLVCLLLTVLLYMNIAFLFHNKIIQFLVSFFLFLLSALISYCGKTIIFFDRFDISVRMPFHIDTAMGVLIFFWVGTVLRKQNFIQKIDSLHIFKKMFVLIGSFLLWIIGAYFNKATVNVCEISYGNIFLFLISSFGGIIFVIILSSFFKENRLLNWYGRNSLCIFCVHGFVLGLYEFLLWLTVHEKKSIMVNLNTYEVFVGTVLVFVLSGILSIPFSKVLKVVINKIESSFYACCNKNRI